MNVLKNVLQIMPPLRWHNRVEGVRTSPLCRKYVCIQDHDDFVRNVMESAIPVIVNFHAEWCDPCHILTHKLKELAGRTEHILLAEVDVEKHADLVHTFEVKAVPAVLAIKNGIVIDKFIGLVDEAVIESLVNKLLRECPLKSNS